jgi:hypothetical protein
MDLSGADPSTINASDVHPLENRQHHDAGPYPEGRRPQRKGSPRGGQEDPSRSPALTASAPSIYSIGGEHSGRRSLEVPVHFRLAPRPQSLSPDFVSQGSPTDQPLCFSPLGPDEALLRLERRGHPGSDGRP